MYGLLDTECFENDIVHYIWWDIFMFEIDSSYIM
jgi:hypothetical protein